MPERPRLVLSWLADEIHTQPLFSRRIGQDPGGKRGTGQHLGSALSGAPKLFQVRQPSERFPGRDRQAIVDGLGTILERLRCRPGLWRPRLDGRFRDDIELKEISGDRPCARASSRETGAARRPVVFRLSSHPAIEGAPDAAPGFRAGSALAVWSGSGVVAGIQHPGGRGSANRPAVSPGDCATGVFTTWRSSSSISFAPIPRFPPSSRSRSITRKAGC